VDDAAAMGEMVWTFAGLVLVVLILITRRARKHGGALQAGLVGATYEMHTRDKQKALDLVVQKKAAARRPEYPAGNLPELEGQGQKTTVKGR
jgi:hypothetical protein